MNLEIEQIDKQRMRYLEWYLIGSAAFIPLTIVRFFFRLDGLNEQPIGIAVLILLIFTLLLLSYSAYRTILLARQIRLDPRLEEALNNEFVLALEAQSWKAAYLGAVAATLFFAVVWFVYPVCDPMMAALTSIVTGAAAYQATFYFKYKNS